jgi:hypothetical protein
VTTLRVAKASLAALPQYKIRVAKVSLTAAVPIDTNLRVAKVSLTAVEAVLVSITPAVTVGPGEAVTLTATLLTSGSPTWTWRRISGPTIGLSPAGAVASFIAPSLWNADRTQPNGGIPGVSTLVLGVKATVGGIDSPEVRCEITILPQVSWAYAGSGVWAGSRVAPA